MSSPRHEGCLETVQKKSITTTHPRPILHQQPFLNLSLTETLGAGRVGAAGHRR